MVKNFLNFSAEIFTINYECSGIRTFCKKLPPKELQIFSDWFEQYTSDKWDEKIEEDILSGRLAKLAAKADKDFESGRCSIL